MENNLAILMADLSGYTAMTDAHGGESAARMVTKYMALVEKSLHGVSRVVQRVGDQVVMIAESPCDLAKTAQNLTVISVEAHFLPIHAGLHYGAIFQKDNSLFGSTINVASRIMNLAGRGQVLCSSTFMENVLDEPLMTFKAFGKHKFKNLSNEIEIFELNTSCEAASFHMDPVCHMLVDRVNEEHLTYYEDKPYYFCSAHCLSLFMANPEAFLAIDQ